jgi:hypothetical protein
VITLKYVNAIKKLGNFDSILISRLQFWLIRLFLYYIKSKKNI